MPKKAPAAPESAAPTAPDPGEAALAAAIADVDRAPAQTVDALPEWAQKIVHDSRAEAAQYRTSAKTAADDAQKHVMDTISAALGLNADLNPDVLAESLRTSQAEAAQNARNLAVYKAAAAAGANPERLMDSRSVMEQLSSIDPTDITAITAAIQAATAANPYLKAVQAAASSGTPMAGSHEDGQLTEEQFASIANDPNAILAAFDSGKLTRLMGGA